MSTLLGSPLAGRLSAHGGLRFGRAHAGAGAGARPAGGRHRHAHLRRIRRLDRARDLLPGYSQPSPFRPTNGAELGLGHRHRAGGRPSRLGHPLARPVPPASRRARILLLTPVVGLAVGGLAVAFAEGSGKSFSLVLFSGQSALPSLLENSASYSVGALILLMACKGLAYGASLSGFRGGPTFPAMFIGAAGGMALVPSAGAAHDRRSGHGNRSDVRAPCWACP